MKIVKKFILLVFCLFPILALIVQGDNGIIFMTLWTPISPFAIMQILDFYRNNDKSESATKLKKFLKIPIFLFGLLTFLMGLGFFFLGLYFRPLTGGRAEVKAPQQGYWGSGVGFPYSPLVIHAAPRFRFRPDPPSGGVRKR